MADKAYTIGDPHRAYVEGCARRQLVFHRCTACNMTQLCGYRVCRACGNATLDEAVSAGLGRVASYTKVHKAASPQFKAIVPFTLALVDLDEGFRAMMHVIHAHDIAIGDRVTIEFAEGGADATLLPFARRLEAGQ